MVRRDVVGALIRAKGRVLIAQRSDRDLNHKWEFPGGKVEAGETHEAALRREILEELGLAIIVQEKVGAAEFSVGLKDYILHCYWAAIEQGEPRPTEHYAISWVPIAELPNHDLAPADRIIVEGGMPS